MGNKGLKILVFSDSHGQSANLEAVMRRSGRGADCVFHLGDGCHDLDEIKGSYPETMFVGVRGNCDVWGDGFNYDEVIRLGGHSFFLTHGHRYSIDYSSEALEAAMKKNGCDVGLYGHTHVPAEVYHSMGDGGGFWLFNPGSIALPRTGRPSFGVIEIQNGSILFSHGEIG